MASAPSRAPDRDRTAPFQARTYPTSIGGPNRLSSSQTASTRFDPLDRSYVTGYGAHPFVSSHHRFFAHAFDPSFPQPPPGVIAGGANANLDGLSAQDPLVGCAPMTCWRDDAQAYSLAEVAINWNAPLAWMAAWASEQGTNAPTVHPGLTGASSGGTGAGGAGAGGTGSGAAGGSSSLAGTGGQGAGPHGGCGCAFSAGGTGSAGGVLAAGALLASLIAAGRRRRRR